MIDAHFHRATYSTFLDRNGEEYCFYGVHPWQVTDETQWDCAPFEAQLRGNARAGVGEIGLDRLHRPSEAVFARQQKVFDQFLQLAATYHRPVVLHGAKCWGKVVKMCEPYRSEIPAFLFHGFSRSGGLIPAIAELNGFISVGPALLNDHAVNYRALVAELPLARVLIETDMADDDPQVDRAGTCAAIYNHLATLRGIPLPELTATIGQNTARFLDH